MIVTVTPNTSIDHVFFIPDFRLNATLRARDVLQSMAGKPTDASWILGEMGIPSLALGFKAGLTGEMVERLLIAQGVTTNFIEVGGESRRNIVLVLDDGSGQTTITASTLEVEPAHIVQLEQHFLSTLDNASCIVLGGTLPRAMDPDLYPRLIRLARQRDIPVIFDASEPYLSAGLAAHPTYIKPNRDELAQLMGHPVNTLADAYAAGMELRDQYGTSPIISLGELGGLAVLPDGAFHIPVLDVEIVNTAGAGDGILAGLAASILQGKPVEYGLRLGFSAAAAVVTQPGTAQCHRADIERFTHQIEIIPFSPFPYAEA